MVGRRGRVRGTLAVVLAGLVVAPAALAYWSASGSGVSGAGTGAASPVVLSPATASSLVHPGASASVDLVARNPGGAEVRISALTLDTSQGVGGFAVDAGHAGCSVSSLAYTTQNNAGNGWTVPRRVGSQDGTRALSLASALALAADAPQACQGATFTVYLLALG